MASATPDRDDRLFPGDIQQFGSGALGLAYGAAGILYALDVTGCAVDHEDWLIEHATNPPSGTGLGLYGAAFTLAHLGHLDAAAKVIDDYLAHRTDDRFAEAREGIRRAARSVYYAQSGLFSGRAGMLLHLARQGDPQAAAHVRDLAWHAVSYEGGLAFPGENLLRLSMDLGTGTAGVLLALGAAMHDRPVHLPFLAAPEQPARTLAGVGDTNTTGR